MSLIRITTENSQTLKKALSTPKGNTWLFLSEAIYKTRHIKHYAEYGYEKYREFPQYMSNHHGLIKLKEGVVSSQDIASIYRDICSKLHEDYTLLLPDFIEIINIELLPIYFKRNYNYELNIKV